MNKTRSRLIVLLSLVALLFSITGLKPTQAAAPVALSVPMDKASSTVAETQGINAIFFQDFNSGIPPAGWTITNNGGTCVWSDDALESSPEGNQTGGTGKFADADSDNCGSGTTMNTTLMSPPIDLSSAPSGTTLRFKHYYVDFIGQYGEVQIRPTATDTWYTLATFTTTTNGEQRIDITSYIGFSDARIRFNFVSPSWGWYWQVDDVGIYEPAPEIRAQFNNSVQIAQYNELITYSLHLDNTGNLASNTGVLVPLPAGMSYLPDSVNCIFGICSFNSGTNTVEWTVSVPANSNASLTFTFRDTLAVCRTIEVSANISDISLPGGLTTTSETQVVPQRYYESTFESDNGGFNSNDWEWGIINNNAFPSGPDTAHSGTQAWGMELYAPYNYDVTYILTRTLDLTAFNPLTGLSLTWWEWYDLTDYGESTRDIGYVKINGTHLHAVYGNTGNQWVQRSIDLTPYAGQTVELMFYLDSIYGGSPGWYIDDVSIYAACPNASLDPNYTQANLCPASEQWINYNLINRTGITETFQFSVAINRFTPVFSPISVTLASLSSYDGGYTYFDVPADTPYGITDVFTITATGQNSGITAVSVVETNVGPFWQNTLADIPSSPYQGAFVAYDNVGYYFGDYNNTLAYIPISNTWQTLNSRQGYSGSEVSDVCLGHDGNGHPTVTLFPNLWNNIAEVYDISTDSWYTFTVTTPYPQYGISALDIVSDLENNRCYLSGGMTSSDGSTTELTPAIYEYNPATQNITFLTNLTTPRFHHASWLMEQPDERYLCVGGGSNNLTTYASLQSTQCYDLINTNLLPENATLGALPYPVLMAADAEKLWYGQRQLWLIGGIENYPLLLQANGVQQSSETIETSIYWDPAQEAWITDTLLAQPAYDFEADVLSSEVYAAGGSVVIGGITFDVSMLQRHTQCNPILPETPSMSVDGQTSARFSGADILQMSHDGPEIAIPSASLGLTPANDLSSLSYGHDYYADPFPLEFSVAPGATGLAGTDLWQQSNCSSDEALADEYGVKHPGYNRTVFDENGFACGTEPTEQPIGFKLGEDLDALVTQPPNFADWELDGQIDAPIYFSLAPGSPFLSDNGLSAADIFVVSPTVSIPDLYALHNELGLLPGDVIDALVLEENGLGGYQRPNESTPNGDLLIFSLAADSPSLSFHGFNPGDLLTPDRELTGTVPILAYPAELLGLTNSDDIDALKGISWYFAGLAPYPQPRGALGIPSPCNPTSTGATESWEWLPSLPLERAFGFAAIAGDWLYVGNGESIYGEDTYAFAFNRINQEWYRISVPPVPRTQTAAVCAEPTVGAGQIYVVGGAINIGAATGIPTAISSVYAYNPQTDTWQQKTSMPTPRASLGLAWDPERNLIYAVGGEQYTSEAFTTRDAIQSTPSAVLEIYNVANDSWASAASMPEPLSYIGSTVYDSQTQKLFVFGGMDVNDNVVDTVFVYDTQTNTWSSLPEPVPQAAFGSVAGFCNGNIHVIGGFNGSSDLATNRIFDPLNQVWLPNGTAMPQARSNMMSSAISTGEEIYIAGGIFEESPYTDFWRYTCGGSQAFAYIGDTIWHDLDGDGIQNDTEPGLSGVEVALVLPDNTVYMTTSTDSSGVYLFEAPPDMYYLRVTPPTNFVFTPADQGGDDTSDSDFNALGESMTFSAIEGNNLDWDAGLFQYADVSGMKYEDRNGNGTRDTGEPGIANWVIWLDNGNGIPISTTTDASGLFYFVDIPPGVYTLTEDLPNGWAQTQPAGGFYNFTLTSGQSVTNQDFGNYAEPTLTVYKYHDLNGNGTHNIIEPYLPNWTINIFDGENTYTLTTDSNGKALFTGLLPGTYTITEELPTDWIQTQPGTPDYYTVTLLSGDNPTFRFGNFAYGSIQGIKFEDLNGNGDLETGENLLAGWLITATYSSSFWGSGILTTTTDSNGMYTFDMLPPGIYVIEEDLPDGWYQTLPGSPDTPEGYTFSLQSGDSLTGNDFGNYIGGVIEGYKFNDIDGNGVWNDEPALSGWVIYLDLNNNGRKDANEPRTQTDEFGFYGFYGLTLGAYTIAEEQQPGWQQTYPISGTHTIVLDNSAMIATDINFGNVQVSGIGDRVWLDLNGDGIQEPAEPPVSHASVFLYDADLNLRASTTTNARGDYAFSNLPPGDYIVGFSAPDGTVFTLPDAGGDDTLDSDANRSNGLSPVITLDSGEFNDTVDAGLFRDDLFAYDFDLFTKPPSVRQGQNPDVGLNLRRGNGIGTLSHIQIAFYLGNPENGGTLLGLGEIPTMTARSSITTTVSWLPAPTAGNYVLYAVIDPNDTIPETNETNNIISRTITVLPATSPDSEPPIVTAVYVTPTIQLTNIPTITIGAAAEDNAGGSGIALILYAEAIYSHTVGNWVVVQRTNWLPYAANHANLNWLLDETPGVHFIMAWAADRAGNISERPKVNFIVYYPGPVRATDFTGYADIAGGDVHLLRLPLQAGLTYTIRVTSLEGDADLYVWNPDDSAAGISENDARVNPIDEVTFTATQTAVYQVEVEGYADFSTYQIEIEVGGLPGLEDVRAPYRPRSQPITNAVAAPGSDVGVPSAPTESAQGNTIYLPIVFR